MRHTSINIALLPLLRYERVLYLFHAVGRGNQADLRSPAHHQPQLSCLLSQLVRIGRICYEGGVIWVYIERRRLLYQQGNL